MRIRADKRNPGRNGIGRRKQERRIERIETRRMKPDQLETLVLYKEISYQAGLIRAQSCSQS